MTDGRVIGVDLGGTKLLAGAVDENLTVTHRAVRPAPPGDQDTVLDAIAALVDEVCAHAGPVDAVGVGLPSRFDLTRGLAVGTVHLPLHELPFAELMAVRLGVPVVADNDATLAMVAEHRAGAARGHDHALLLTLGTGIGGGIVVAGQIVRGALGAAGELGHMVVDLDGPPCQGNCPSRGCLEAVASGNALGREALAAAHAHPDSELGRALAQGQEVTGALATELAHAGDPTAVAAVARIGTYLGVGIASLVNVFNPSVVVVGGGVIGAGELLLAPARAELARRALTPARDAVEVVAARFGADSGMLGAALLARGSLSGAGRA